MMRNMIRSIFRFLGSVIRPRLPFSPRNDSMFDVVNILRYSNTLYSSGQPTEKQLESIAKAGFSLVINLAPYDFIEHPLKDEEKIVTGLGMRYVHIPVRSSNPRNSDFQAFSQALQQASGEKVWIHCAINLRASAFVYRYRCSVLGEDEHKARWDLREIWEPFGVWKAFIQV